LNQPDKGKSQKDRNFAMLQLLAAVPKELSALLERKESEDQRNGLKKTNTTCPDILQK